MKIANDSISYRLHGFNTPFLFHYYPSPKLKLSIGPELNYIFAAENVGTADSTNIDLAAYEGVAEVGMVIGVSYSLEFFVDVGIRYGQSFTNLNGYDEFLDTRNLRTRYLQFFILLKIAN